MQIHLFGPDLVIGLGETGRPLLEILQETYTVVGKDIEPLELAEPINVLHVCIPFVNDFVAVAASYVAKYAPQFVVVHTTVVPGTTRALYERSGVPVAFSPIRGKHTRMQQDLLRYTKFVAGVTPEATDFALHYFDAAGFITRCVSHPEALELSKIVETTYFGVLLAWAQEVERYCELTGSDYEEVMAFCAEVPYLPPVTFQPGFIGGHCVIPNTYLLEKLRPSAFIDVIRGSNEAKRQQWLASGRDFAERLSPRPTRNGSPATLPALAGPVEASPLPTMPVSVANSDLRL